MPVLGPLICNFCFEQLGFGEFWSHFQSATLTRGRTAPAGKFLWRETFFAGELGETGWQRMLGKHFVPSAGGVG